MRLTYSPAAVKGLRKVPREDADGLRAKLRRVADDPTGHHPWATRLTDQPGFRVREGNWRAVYRLDHKADEMIVDAIAKRGEIYR